MSLSKPLPPPVSEPLSPAAKTSKTPKLADVDVVCQFARLAVCKDLRYLFEPTVRTSMQKLVRQNIRLKRRLFYKDFSTSMLREHLMTHNLESMRPYSTSRLCSCPDCILLCRNSWRAINPLNGTRCLLMESFVKLCNERRLVIKHNPVMGKAARPLNTTEFKYDCTVYNVEDCDIFFGTEGAWDTIGYSLGLAMEAHNASSPRIKALQSLFFALAIVNPGGPAVILPDDYDSDSLWQDDEADEGDLSDSEADEPTQPVDFSPTPPGSQQTSRSPSFR